MNIRKETFVEMQEKFLFLYAKKGNIFLSSSFQNNDFLNVMFCATEEMTEFRDVFKGCRS